MREKNMSTGPDRIADIHRAAMIPPGGDASYEIQRQRNLKGSGQTNADRESDYLLLQKVKTGHQVAIVRDMVREQRP